MIKLASLIKESINKPFLTERFINLQGKDEREKYLDVVWDMLHTAYADIGGFLSSNKESIINETDMWKICTRNGEVTAVMIYAFKRGVKVIGAATNGTSVGKADFMKMVDEDVKQKRTWAEVSGKSEHIYLKYGAEKIPNTEAHRILNKHIISLNPDGYHYTRLIGGKPHEKLIVGTIK